jgi:hypothetical protein
MEIANHGSVADLPDTDFTRLKLLVSLWPQLPEEARAQIMRIVQETHIN